MIYSRTKVNLLCVFFLVCWIILTGCRVAESILSSTPPRSTPLATVPTVSEPTEVITFDHYHPTPIPTVFWTTNLVTVQKSLLGDPCLAPCWYDIEPHRTTITATLAILNQLQEQSIIQDFYLKNSPASTGYVVIFAHDFDGAIEGSKGIVETIGFSMSAKYLTLGELLIAYGEPDYVSSAQGESYEGLSLAYLSNQLIVYIRTEQLGGEQLVTPDLMITSLTYLLPARFSEIVEDSNLGWVKWDGQQSFSYYYQKTWEGNQ